MPPSRTQPPFAARLRGPLSGLLLGCCLLVLAGCEPATDDGSDVRFRWAGTVESGLLDEISGLAASRRHDGVLWVHNDDGEPRIHAIGTSGEDLGSVLISDAVNVDWEDMTLIPGADRDLLVLADIGDNNAERQRVWLYLADEPEPDADGRFSGEVPARNWISLSYPEGPRDSESIAWDALQERLLILSKRDKPPRLYALDGIVAQQARAAELSFLGEVTSLRPPSESDRKIFDQRAPYISQPTGLTLSPDGERGAIITYRSLYLFDLPVAGDWAEGLNATPYEIIGPPRKNEEAVGFNAEGTGLWVSSEGDRAPLYEFILADKETPVPDG